ncbi:hypothetical protein QN382_08715 [Pseudomonas sp. 10B1]|uniref:hypothetical protein n=1 Tax=unclassified Pseudomonas TaxID=196821 RepID=UPI002B235716|nr:MULTISPECIES: hypothetical protein [unclassified Pseudomonas]MEA9994657.1 hypothetical protein [Pseudomonas sp. AA4]MEB0085802.1 hypothetical protein [Pseudomonas sp. RTI1]MEB0125873.1 hypothetical protein [Pseudomonas sp. CCC1.2]MEB0155639.1 hypothetical protein [Pseudomonas sp. CCC4.3]MEB0220062.1 hypothetical protein [Pseudomonas sp. AB12(2023)]
MYRQTLLSALLGLTLAGCYAGPGYYESDVYTAPVPVYGGYYYGAGGYDRYYGSGYVIGQPRYYGPRSGVYYQGGHGYGRPGYGNGPWPGRGYAPGAPDYHGGFGYRQHPGWGGRRPDSGDFHGGWHGGHDGHGQGGRR